jgi:hypothetical protein
VTGTVTLDGQPLEGASVVFVPAAFDAQAAGGSGDAGIQQANGQTDASGKFTVSCVAGEGAMPGTYKVAVSKLEAGSAEAGKTVAGQEAKGAPPGTMLSGPGGGGPKQPQAAPKYAVPAKYINPDTSGIEVEVKSGMDPVTIELTSG